MAALCFAFTEIVLPRDLQKLGCTNFRSKVNAAGRIRDAGVKCNWQCDPDRRCESHDFVLLAWSSLTFAMKVLAQDRT